MLELAANAVEATCLTQQGSGLMEIERDSLRDALATNVEHPVVVAHAGIGSRFASYRHFVDVAVEQSVKIERTQQR